MSHNHLDSASPSASGLPAALVPLADLPIWVGWKKDKKPGETKVRKMPVNPATGQNAKSNDPSTWGTASAALAAVGRHGLLGVGVQLGDLGDGRWLIGKDLDLCRSPGTGEIMPWAREEIASWGSYGEISPSGTGVKLFGYVTSLPPQLWGQHKNQSKGLEVTIDAPTPEGAEGSGHDKPEIGLYPGYPGGGRYFAVTGERLPGCPDHLVDVTEAVAKDAARMAPLPACAKVKLEIDRTKLPDRVVEILDTDDRLRGAYETGEKPTGDGKDDSDSALDFSIARYMAANEHDDEDIELVIRHCPNGQLGRGKLNGHNAARRIERLLKEATKVREKGAKDTATVAMLAERHVYDLSIRMYYDKVTGEDISPLAFCEKWAHEVAAAHPKLMKLKTMVKADRSDYLPGEPRLTFDDGKAVVLNRHRPSDLVPAGGDYLPILRHFEWLIPDAAERGHVLDVLAFVLQNPGRKVKHAIILHGVEGNGKSVIRQIMELIVGLWNLRQLGGDFLSKDNSFKKQLGNCRVLWVEELMQPGRMEVANDLKEWITEPMKRAQEKGQPFVLVRTPYLIVATTNHDVAVYASGGDRRYFVASTDPELLPQPYYDELMREDLLRDRAAAFAHWLLARDVSGFNPNARPPMTAAKEMMIKGSRSALADLVEDLMEQGTMNRAVMTAAEIKKVLSELGAYKPGHTPDRHISDALKSLGWWTPGKDRKVRIGGHPQRVWVSPNAPELRNAAGPDLAKRWEEERFKGMSDEMRAKIHDLAKRHGWKSALAAAGG